MSDIKKLSGGNVPPEIEIFHHTPKKGEVWQVNDPFYSVWMSDDPFITVLIIEELSDTKVRVLNPKGVEDMYLWVFNKDAKKIC